MNAMKATASVAAVSLTIVATVGLLAVSEQTPPEPWQRFEQADIPAGHVEVRPTPVWPAAVWAAIASQRSRGSYEDNGSFASRWSPLPLIPWQATNNRPMEAYR